MIELSPIALWYRISDQARQLLAKYQMDKYGLKLDIPPYIVYYGYTDYDRLMRQKPYKPRKVK